MSTTCVDDLKDSLYVPFGMGVADSIVVIVSDNDLYPNCNITFYSEGPEAGVYLIVVVEFPDHTEGPNNACQDVNSRIFVSKLITLENNRKLPSMIILDTETS